MKQAVDPTDRASAEALTRDTMLSVVIPTYNEAHRLPRTLREIHPYLCRRFPRHEIVVVADKSPDGTAELAERIGAELGRVRVLVQPGRLGKGAAVRRGCLESRGDHVLFMDADHATPIDELDEMFPVLQRLGSGAVVGVRTYQEDERRWRRIVGLAAQLLAHLIVFRKAVCDSQCGFKLFSRDVVEKVFPRCRVDGGMLDVEIFFLLHIQDIPCRYHPVHWVNKEGSRINVLRCMARDPIDMLKIRLRGRLGVYERPIPAERQPWHARSEMEPAGAHDHGESNRRREGVALASVGDSVDLGAAVDLPADVDHPAAVELPADAEPRAAACVALAAPRSAPVVGRPAA